MSMDYEGYGGYGGEDYPEYGVSPDLVPAGSADEAHRDSEPAAPSGEPEFYSLMTQGPTNDVYAAPQPAPVAHPAGPPPRQVAVPMHAQAVGQPPQAEPAGQHGLGVSLLLVAVGAAVGYKFGGWAGGGAGVLGAGAAVNGYRALTNYRKGTEEGKKEGRVSALYTLVGAGGGALLWHKYADTSRMKANRSRREGGDTDSPFESPCGIRPVGP